MGLKWLCHGRMVYNLHETNKGIWPEGKLQNYLHDSSGLFLCNLQVQLETGAGGRQSILLPKN